MVGLSRRAWYRGDPSDKQLSKDAPVIDELNILLRGFHAGGSGSIFIGLGVKVSDGTISVFGESTAP